MASFSLLWQPALPAPVACAALRQGGFQRHPCVETVGSPRLRFEGLEQCRRPAPAGLSASPSWLNEPCPPPAAVSSGASSGQRLLDRPADSVTSVGRTSQRAVRHADLPPASASSEPPCAARAGTHHRHAQQVQRAGLSPARSPSGGLHPSDSRRRRPGWYSSNICSTRFRLRSRQVASQTTMTASGWARNR